MLIHVGTKEIKTKRLILRPFKKSDAPDMFKNWANDDEVTQYVTWPTHTSVDVSEMVINSWIKEYQQLNYYQWAIVLKENQKLIGCISLLEVDDHLECAEIGYCLGKAYWNQGIMSEACAAIIELAFNEVDFERLIARHDVRNKASGCVMKKCGLTYEGTHRKSGKSSQGEFVDCCYYSILKEDY